jgi:hypothetical protein
MKFEIDLSDRSQLVKAKDELARFLTIVEFALTQQNGHNRTVNGQEPLALIEARTSQVRDAYKPIMEIVKGLPNSFTTSDVIIALGDNGKEYRAVAKGAIADAVQRGIIRLVEVGKGRRPSKFSKV